MMFKNRKDAGEKLVKKIKKDRELMLKLQNAVVISLLRGGAVVGKIIAKNLKLSHYPLVVAKIPAPKPHSPELAIGAVCGDIVYRDKQVLLSIGDLPPKIINKQIKEAQKKQKKYFKKYNINSIDYNQNLAEKTVILVDDGIATGSTIRAAGLFVKSKKAKRIILAVPVSPYEFDKRGFDKTVILHQDFNFFSVGQFYQYFPEINTDTQL